jgi:ABC-type multidrug transport system fused ATPase/permease subunit
MKGKLRDRLLKAKELITSIKAKYHIRLVLTPFTPSLELDSLIGDLMRSRTSIDEKIQKAFDSLQETYGLIGELEKTLKEKNENLTFLRQESEKYSKLAEVEEDHARALIQQLERSLGKGRRREHWVNLVISLTAGIIIFIIGIWVSPIIRALL